MGEEKALQCLPDEREGTQFFDWVLQAFPLYPDPRCWWRWGWGVGAGGGGRIVYVLKQ